MKADIRYAENTVNFDDDKLKIIGWAGRKERTPLAPPGQELEYRIIAVNKAGEGEPSNTAMVVL